MVVVNFLPHKAIIQQDLQVSCEKIEKKSQMCVSVFLNFS